MLSRVEIICFQTEKFSRHRLACTKNGTFSAYYGEEGGAVGAGGFKEKGGGGGECHN